MTKTEKKAINDVLSARAGLDIVLENVVSILDGRKMEPSDDFYVHILSKKAKNRKRYDELEGTDISNRVHLILCSSKPKCEGLALQEVADMTGEYLASQVLCVLHQEAILETLQAMKKELQER